MLFMQLALFGAQRHQCVCTVREQHVRCLPFCGHFLHVLCDVFFYCSEKCAVHMYREANAQTCPMHTNRAIACTQCSTCLHLFAIFILLSDAGQHSVHAHIHMRHVCLVVIAAVAFLSAEDSESFEVNNNNTDSRLYIQNQQHQQSATTQIRRKTH